MPEQQIIIKKKRGGEGHAHHGGSWKVAYADFMTAMMAFFMVMWIMGLSEDTRNQIQGYFNDPLGFSKSEPKTKTLISIEGIPTSAKTGRDHSKATDAHGNEQKKMEEMEKQIKQALKQDKSVQGLLDGVRVEVTPDGLLIEFSEVKGAVFFESGSSVIRPQATELIHRIAPILAKSGAPLEVQGHTDAEQFPGASNGNWRLSGERALSLQGALEDGSVQDKQFVQVCGFAATRLLDSSHPNSYSNRRVTILIPRKYKEGDQSETPGDALRSSLADGANPQAVEIKPLLQDLQKPIDKFHANK